MKEKFAKVKAWLKNHLPTKRRIVQLYMALLYNANVKGFVTGKISTAGSKNMCVPGFNCYSCPGAIGSCPLGSIQNALGSGKTSTIAYVFGIIVLFGLILGRTICGWLCPMGLLQDLLYKIKSPKVHKNKVTKVLSYFKYVLLLAFVVIMPLIYSEVIVLPAFCQYICPIGTISGLTLLANPANTAELVSLGVLFTWKICVLIVIFIASIFIFRPFCRFMCPLGALYSLFSKFSFLGIKLDEHKCVDCGLCIRECKVDIKKVGDHECIQCGDCVAVCPTKAISWKGGKLFVAPNQDDKPVVTEKVDLMAIVNKNQSSQESAQVDVVVEEIAQNDVEQQVGETVDNQVEMTPEVESVEAPAEKEVVKLVKNEKKSPLYALRKNNGLGFKIIAVVLMVAILVSALVYFNACHEETVAQTVYKVGDTMANFETKEYFSTDGTYSLEEDAGKIVVLNFWFVGCVGCEMEMPHFGELACDENYNDKVSVVVAHGSEPANKETAETLVDYNGAQVPAVEWYIYEKKGWGDFASNIKWVLDVEGESSMYLAIGGRGAYPSTVIIDQNGVVRFIAHASVTKEILYREIDAILAE